jgi:hypothetical protein
MGTLSQTTTISSSDWITLYKNDQGDFRGISFTDLTAALQAALTLGRAEAVSQYAAPSTDPFTVAITDGDDDIHLMLTPTLGVANATITLPSVANVRDKQLVIVNCTQAIAALTVNGNGALAVTGEPAAMLANEFFTLCYDLPTSTWYRIS